MQRTDEAFQVKINSKRGGGEGLRKKVARPLIPPWIARTKTERRKGTKGGVETDTGEVKTAKTQCH